MCDLPYLFRRRLYYIDTSLTRPSASTFRGPPGLILEFLYTPPLALEMFTTDHVWPLGSLNSILIVSSFLARTNHPSPRSLIFGFSFAVGFGIVCAAQVPPVFTCPTLQENLRTPPEFYSGLFLLFSWHALPVPLHESCLTCPE